MKRKLWLGAAFFIPIVCLLAISIYGLFFADDPRKIPTQLLQTKAAPFTLPDLSGSPVSLGDFTDRPVILNFWASWCIPCKVEAQELESIHRKYRVDNVAIIGVGVDDTVANMQAFKTEQDVSFITVSDTDSGDVMLDYGVTGIPETFFISPDGIIVEKIYGAVTADQIENFLAAYIN